MNVILFLVPLALGLGFLGLAAFLWSLRSGQFDDLDGASFRVLSDDDLPDTRSTNDVNARGASPSRPSP